jgi:hypothetical protein
VTTINGRRVKMLKEDVVGTARGWKPESDWMKVVTDDGVTHMVHCTDKIEILRDSSASVGEVGHAPDRTPRDRG